MTVDWLPGPGKGGGGGVGGPLCKIRGGKPDGYLRNGGGKGGGRRK